MTEIGEKKKYRGKIGDIFRIKLEKNLYGYGQIVSKVEHAFFDYFNDGSISNLSEIVSSNIIFRISVDSYVIRDGFWEIIGNSIVAGNLKISLPLFTHDIYTNEYTIWTTQGKRPGTPDEIQNLECLASWGNNHVEQRLKDHLAGRPNYDVEHFRNLHNPNFERNSVTFYKQYGYDFKIDDDSESED